MKAQLCWQGMALTNPGLSLQWQIHRRRTFVESILCVTRTSLQPQASRRLQVTVEEPQASRRLQITVAVIHDEAAKNQLLRPALETHCPLPDSTTQRAADGRCPNNI